MFIQMAIQTVLPAIAAFFAIRVIRTRKYKNYIIKYSFSYPSWDEKDIKRSIAYWESRDFSCTSLSDQISGTRGSEQGNLHSNDMTKLICVLRVIKTTSGKISSEMHLDGRFQYITEWNKLDFVLEQLQFKRYLLGKGEAEFVSEYWKVRKFKKGSLPLFGKKSTFAFWKRKIESLADGEILPVFEVDLSQDLIKN